MSDNEEVLLMKRGPKAKGSEQGKWENCGGGVEKGEQAHVAAFREVREELGVEVSIDRELLRLRHE